MSITELWKGNGPSGFGYGSTTEQVTDGLSLAGRTYLVTGCNAGLGFEACRVLALRGARVIGTSRTLDKAAEASSKWSGGPVLPIACELSDPSSVRACVAELKRQGVRLDGIICNAGIMALPKLETAHGYEMQFFTNHVGHFLLVTGLLDQLTDNGRVVMLSSAAHSAAPKGAIEWDNLDGSKGYAAWRAYGQSKIANLLFAKELARRFAGTSRTANAVHPGVIATNLGRHMSRALWAVFAAVGSLFMKSIPQGAATEIFVATHPSLATVSGEYFADCNVARPRKDAEDPAIARRLWEETERIVAKL